MVLILVTLLAIVMPAWLGFVALQRRMISDQQQEELSSQISEAGVQYALFLLNSSSCSPTELVMQNPIVQTITDADGQVDLGRYALSVLPEGNDLKITARGYSVNKPRRCQTMMATISPAWTLQTISRYYIKERDFLRQSDCAETAPAVTTISCGGS